jgi:dTDP-4-dehydrorhamnose reductase
MKILVTGSEGQLGNSLKRLAGNYKEHTFSFIDIGDLDLTDSARLADFLTVTKPSVLINCAAYTAVDKAESEPEKAMAVNAFVPGEMARICPDMGIRLIHISTDYVFDGRSYTPYKETDPVNPLSVYAKSKMEGENRIRKENVKGIILRTSWLYSEFGGNFVKTILKKGKEAGKLNVVYDQVGGPTYAGDLARTILDILPQVMDSGSMEVYHYANEGVVSWYDFARAIIGISGTECIVEPIGTEAYPTPAARPSYSVFNKTKFKKQFGLPIPYWRDSLEICIGNLAKSDS